MSAASVLPCFFRLKLRFMGLTSRIGASIGFRFRLSNASDSRSERPDTRGIGVRFFENNYSMS